MRRHALLLVALLPALYPARVGAASCDELPKPAVSVKRFDEPVAVSARYGYRTLTIMGDKITRPGQLVLGLTRGNAVVKVETRLPSVIDRSGQWECVSPQITLHYGYSPLTMFVASEFPAGACPYKEIHAHELRHVQTYQAHLLAIEQAISDTLQARFATGAPWRGPLGEARARIQQELAERWVPYITREMNKVDAAQALVDTPEEYARVAASCNGEIGKVTLAGGRR